MVPDILKYSLVLLAAVALIVVVIVRRRSHREFVQQTVDAEVCPHLRAAFDLLRSRGHAIVRAGQKHPDFPFEVHMAPSFDPKAVYTELKLEEPVFVSERNVLGCHEDWVELRPVKG